MKKLLSVLLISLIVTAFIGYNSDVGIAKEKTYL